MIFACTCVSNIHYIVLNIRDQYVYCTTYKFKLQVYIHNITQSVLSFEESYLSTQETNSRNSQFKHDIVDKHCFPYPNCSLAEQNFGVLLGGGGGGGGGGGEEDVYKLLRMFCIWQTVIIY